MDLLALVQENAGQGIFLVLFLYIFKRQEHKTDEREAKAEHREARLLEELQKNQEILLTFSSKYDVIAKDLHEIKLVIQKEG